MSLKDTILPPADGDAAGVSLVSHDAASPALTRASHASSADSSSGRSRKRTTSSSKLRLSLRPFRDALVGRSSKAKRTMHELVGEFLSDEVLQAERYLRALAAPSASLVEEEEAAAEAPPPPRRPPVEWRRGEAAPHKPAQLTGLEWHDGVRPLLAAVYRAVSPRALDELPPDEAYELVCRQCQKAAGRILLPQGKDETAADYKKRSEAQRLCTTLILPRSSCEGVSTFQTRMVLIRSLARMYGADMVPWILPQQPSETALQVEQRLDGQVRCVAPILPWGKHETSADFAQRLEAMLLLPRKRGEFKGAHPPLVLPKGRAESAASFAARLKAAAVCEVLLPQSKDETDDMFQRRAAVQVMTLQTEALAPYNSQLETLEEYDMRLSAALPPEESIRSMTSTASYRSDKCRDSRALSTVSGKSSCSQRSAAASQSAIVQKSVRFASDVKKKIRPRKGNREADAQAFQAVVDEGAVFRPQTIVGTPDEADSKAPCGCVCAIL